MSFVTIEGQTRKSQLYYTHHTHRPFCVRKPPKIVILIINTNEKKESLNEFIKVFFFIKVILLFILLFMLIRM